MKILTTPEMEQILINILQNVAIISEGQKQLEVGQISSVDHLYEAGRRIARYEAEFVSRFAVSTSDLRDFNERYSSTNLGKTFPRIFGDFKKVKAPADYKLIGLAPSRTEIFFATPQEDLTDKLKPYEAQPRMPKRFVPSARILIGQGIIGMVNAMLIDEERGYDVYVGNPIVRRW